MRLFGANCFTARCWLSGLFAPIVVRENLAVLTISNEGDDEVTVTPRFTPTNGLAIALGGAGPFGELKPIKIPPGQIASLQLQLPNSWLGAGLYTGQLSLAMPNHGTLWVSVEARVRSSVVWALVTAVLGIVLGRLAQLVYDPKMTARLQLLDRLNDIEQSLRDITDRSQLESRLEHLHRQLASRSGDVSALLPQVEQLEKDVEALLMLPPPVPAGGAGAAMAGPSSDDRTAPSPPNPARSFLLWLAGVAPVPLQFVYDWLMPVFVLLTLVAVTIVFVLQQYGGSGTADTFGANGLSDYAGLFLAGLASEAIVSGLRSIKLK